MNEEQISLIIQNGKRFMPSFKHQLTSEQIKSVTDYVKQLRK